MVGSSPRAAAAMAAEDDAVHSLKRRRLDEEGDAGAGEGAAVGVTGSAGVSSGAPSAPATEDEHKIRIKRLLNNMTREAVIDILTDM
jgi:hypothetical protein